MMSGSQKNTLIMGWRVYKSICILLACLLPAARVQVHLTCAKKNYIQ